VEGEDDSSEEEEEKDLPTKKKAKIHAPEKKGQNGDKTVDGAAFWTSGTSVIVKLNVMVIFTLLDLRYVMNCQLNDILILTS